MASTDRQVATLTVPAGRSTTSVRFPEPLLRGATLAWSVTAVTAGDRTRVVINLFEMVPYETRADGNKIVVVLGSAGSTTTTTAAAAPTSTPASSAR